jgi:uncharacterized pyridoxal phosphate-containing UPF0001 family protein
LVAPPFAFFRTPAKKPRFPTTEKGGIEPDDIFDVAKHIKTSCTKLNLLGLMTIGMIDRDETPNPDFVVSQAEQGIARGCG